jgi:hypothetical protein
MRVGMRERRFGPVASFATALVTIAIMMATMPRRELSRPRRAWRLERLSLMSLARIVMGGERSRCARS